VPKILNQQDAPELVLLVETNQGTKAIVAKPEDTQESIQTWIQEYLSRYLQVTDTIGWFKPAAAPKAKKSKAKAASQPAASKPADPQTDPAKSGSGSDTPDPDSVI
jgi:hypothetical protein